MLESFTEFLVDKPSECSVQKWLNTLTSEDQGNYLRVEEKYRAGANISMVHVYKALAEEVSNLPFKLTSFRSHMNGTCTCQRN
jgi:tryptophanyl-tRNA synthetase